MKHTVILFGEGEHGGSGGVTIKASRLSLWLGEQKEEEGSDEIFCS